MAGDALYRIADLSIVWLEGEVFEQDLGVTQVGQLVTAEFQALPGESREGRITYVYPTLDPETRTGRIRVTLANPGLRLKPGMFATLRFAPPCHRAVLSVPRSAVLSTGTRNLVFLKRPDGKFTPTDVRLGAQTEDRLEILSGLAAGDTVVASATFLLDAESNLGTLLGGMGEHARHGHDGAGGADATAPRPAVPRRPHPASRGLTPCSSASSTGRPGNRLLVILGTLFAVAGGVWAVRHTPLEALPDLSDVQVIVQAEYGEQAPRIVEDQVTYPIAAEMLKVPGARTVRGYSFFGVSSCT